MTDNDGAESTRRIKQEITFVVESWVGEDYRASRESDHQTDDTRVPGAIYYGMGDSELEAMENLVTTQRANHD